MKSLHSQNFYEILGVSRYASPEEIRHAYELSKQTFTQDSMATYSLFSEDEQDEILEIVGLAYETLLNPQSRREYDTFLDSGEVGSHSAWMAWRRPRSEGSREPVPGQDAADAVPARPGTPGAPLESPPPLSGTSPADRPSAPTLGSGGVPGTVPPQGAGGSRPAVAAVAGQPRQEAPGPPTEPPAATGATQIERFIDGVQHFNGSVLRQARELHGMSLRDVCDHTKIRQTYVEYIESENFAGLPAPVYVKGFVRLLASALTLPPDRVVNDYMSRYEQHNEQKLQQ